MRWKVLGFSEKLDSSEKETFGFKLHKCTPSVEELSGFKSDLLTMLHNK